MAPKQRTSERVRLWDLPDAWAGQLMTRLSSKELHHLFSTNTACRTLVLKHAPTTTLSFSMLQQQSSLAVMLCSLQLASQHSRSIALHLYHGRAGHILESGRLPARDLFTTISSALLRAASDMNLTVNITTLKLQGACLGSPLPLAISEACPNLSTLILRGATLDWDKASAASFSACFPKLQTLTVSGGEETGDSRPWQQLLQQQVAQLANLQSLTLNNWCNPDSGEHAILRGVIAAQLTSVTLHEQAMTDPQLGGWLQPTRAAQYTMLQQLVMPTSSVDDADIRVLLSLPSLTQVEACEFAVFDNFANNPVQWQQLTVYYLQVAQLTRLPLGNTELQLICKQDPDGDSVLDILDATDVAVIDQALRNISHCKGLQWQDMGVRLGDGWEHVELRLQEQLLDKILLLVAGARSIHLVNTEFTESIVQSICRWLKENPVCTYVSLDDSCTWSVLACATIMSSIPVEGTLNIYCDSEADITKLCCLAEKPVNLSVECSLTMTSEEFLKHAHAAMHMCGHQYVNLLLW